LKREIERMGWREFIGWIGYDRAECIGPERAEWMAAIQASITASAAGAKMDVYDVLESLPWNKFERPMPSVSDLERQINLKAGAYLKQIEEKKHG